jgi:hypothetical protein
MGYRCRCSSSDAVTTVTCSQQQSHTAQSLFAHSYRNPVSSFRKAQVVRGVRGLALHVPVLIS